MLTEIKQAYNSGFLINEIELTRIKDLINEQIKKQNNNVDGVFAYEVKFANGAISKPLSISEILSEENHGSGRICRLIMHCKANDQPESASIELQFVDASVDEDSIDKTINYTIRANDKD